MPVTLSVLPTTEPRRHYDCTRTAPERAAAFTWAVCMPCIRAWPSASLLIYRTAGEEQRPGKAAQNACACACPLVPCCGKATRRCRRPPLDGKARVRVVVMNSTHRLEQSNGDCMAVHLKATHSAPCSTNGTGNKSKSHWQSTQRQTSITHTPRTRPSRPRPPSSAPQDVLSTRRVCRKFVAWRATRRCALTTNGLARAAAELACMHDATKPNPAKASIQRLSTAILLHLDEKTLPLKTMRPPIWRLMRSFVYKPAAVTTAQHLTWHHLTRHNWFGAGEQQRSCTPVLCAHGGRQAGKLIRGSPTLPRATKEGSRASNQCNPPGGRPSTQTHMPNVDCLPLALCAMAVANESPSSRRGKPRARRVLPLYKKGGAERGLGRQPNQVDPPTTGAYGCGTGRCGDTP